MKNIHILPTEKPSSLYYKDDNYKLANSTIAIDWYISSAGYKPTNIYITNDEEIKEGDWVVTPNKTIMLVTTKYATESSFMIGNSKHKGSPYYIEFCRKIILTTDQDLIKDGVQPIDDEFLQWFVKNPSCESVEVESGLFFYAEGEDRRYKIIIPQEEPKQDLEKEMFDLEQELDIPSSFRWHNSKPKQETLEEVAERWNEKQTTLEFGKPHNAPNRIKSFIEGAKWQQEQDNETSHSYDEVRAIAYKAYCIGQLDEPIEGKFNQWINQFKKA